MNTNTKTVKGFTLIELLVVIGILAVLSVVIILTLNPAELLKQARDSTRVSDMATLKTAISLYQVDITSPKFGDADKCYTSLGASVAGIINGCGVTGATGEYLRFNGVPLPVATVTGAAGTATDGTGWVRVNIVSISTGSGGPPISNLPLDPVNTNAIVGTAPSALGYYYAYRAGGAAGCTDAGTACTAYEINTVLESAKFVNQLSNDGGNSTKLYEVGTDPLLDL